MTSSNLTQLQTSLTRRLSHSFDATQINEIASSVATLNSNGIKIDDIFPYGIRVKPDGASIRGHITAIQLQDLNKILQSVPGVASGRCRHGAASCGAR